MFHHEVALHYPCDEYAVLQGEVCNNFKIFPQLGDSLKEIESNYVHHV
jgi:hypothetical protein